MSIHGNIHGKDLSKAMSIHGNIHRKDLSKAMCIHGNIHGKDLSKAMFIPTQGATTMDWTEITWHKPDTRFLHTRPFGSVSLFQLYPVF